MTVYSLYSDDVIIGKFQALSCKVMCQLILYWLENKYQKHWAHFTKGVACLTLKLTVDACQLWVRNLTKGYVVSFSKKPYAHCLILSWFQELISKNRNRVIIDWMCVTLYSRFVTEIQNLLKYQNFEKRGIILEPFGRDLQNYVMHIYTS